jgi:hypothetical protein
MTHNPSLLAVLRDSLRRGWDESGSNSEVSGESGEQGVEQAWDKDKGWRGLALRLRRLTAFLPTPFHHQNEVAMFVHRIFIYMDASRIG